MSPAFIEVLRGMAEAKDQEEADCRRESRQRLERLAVHRTHAYRRYNLLKDMAAAAEGQAEQAPSVEAQLAVASMETGWTEEKAGYGELRDHLRPVAILVHAALHPSAKTAKTTDPPADVAVAAFEEWYRQRFNQDFLDLLGGELPSFQPVVDF